MRCFRHSWHVKCDKCRLLDVLQCLPFFSRFCLCCCLWILSLCEKRTHVYVARDENAGGTRIQRKSFLHTPTLVIYVTRRRDLSTNSQSTYPVSFIIVIVILILVMSASEDHDCRVATGTASGVLMVARVLACSRTAAAHCRPESVAPSIESI